MEARGTLSHFNAARRELALATNVDEVKEIRDKAEALRMYAKQQGHGLEMQNQCAEIKLRAERRAGELLAEAPKHDGDPRLHDVTRLADMGISKIESHRWQRVASVPEKAFEKHVAETQTAKKELTTAGVLKLAQKRIRAREWLRNGKAETCQTGDLAKLVSAGKRFGTVYADPPWAYSNQGTRAASGKHYPTMSIEDICALPVAKLAAANAHLHLWTTNAFLFEAKGIIDAWGFEYKSCFVWVKPQMGIGNYWRVSHEFLLLGVRGRCPFLKHDEMSWLEVGRTRHSAKPHEVREKIERVSPNPRLELFGREALPGWAVWGNQIARKLFDDATKNV